MMVKRQKKESGGVTVVKCLLGKGYLPVKQREDDAGFDMLVPEDFIIHPGQCLKIPLGVAFELPEGTHAQIIGRSGLGVDGLVVHAGLIDQGYRGEVSCIMAYVKSLLTFVDALNRKGMAFKKGDRICQMVIHPHRADYQIRLVDKLNTSTDRGTDGMGSTGVGSEDIK